jgi:hypothetical protein
MESLNREFPRKMTSDEATCPDDKHAPDGGGPFVTAVLQRALVSGTCASIASTGVLALAGVRDCASAMAPTNAVSHWIWGDRALRQQSMSAAYTGTGYVIHHAMSVLWASGYEGYIAWRPPATHGHALGAALATSAIAALVDLKFTPKRLTPGFERKLSSRMLWAVYIGFGVALGLRQLFASKHRDG